MVAKVMPIKADLAISSSVIGVPVVWLSHHAKDWISVLVLAFADPVTYLQDVKCMRIRKKPYCVNTQGTEVVKPYCIVNEGVMM